ncbi:glycosyltransferase family 2 protein [Candidatus Woesearchaeota archaeon]|nr:glycosyltransferase family 2 protein [Candidatus Woesearchaeota archaeon]
MKPEISIVIPAYNEQENLPLLIEELVDLIKEQNWNAEIIVVNDHSADKTKIILDSWVKKNKIIQAIHRNNGEKGMGITLREGTNKARGEIIIWSMADRSDNLKTYPELVAKIKEGYDVVFASRYMPGGSSGDLDLIKAFLSKNYANLTKIILNMPVDDVTNAFRAFRKNAFQKLNLESNDFTISPEMTIKV